MINYVISIVVVSLFACLVSTTQSDSSKADPEISPASISVDSVSIDHTSIAYAAVDRQCGSCHHGDRSTNAGALAIFNLTDSCWYCKLTTEQCESLKGRISGPSFSEDERSAIVALIMHLSEENENSTH